jgi:hypothetical protein
MSFNMNLHVWFKHDDAQPRYNNEVHQWLSENDPGCRTGHRHEAPVSWPVFLPDLNRPSFVRFEVFTAVITKNGVFWDVALCRSSVY